MKVGDVFWDYCDIDGHGKKWRIAVCRREDGEKMINYPLDDFSDYADDRHDLRSLKIEPPLAGVAGGDETLAAWIKYTLALAPDDASISAFLSTAMRNERDLVCKLIRQEEAD